MQPEFFCFLFRYRWLLGKAWARALAVRYVANSISIQHLDIKKKPPCYKVCFTYLQHFHLYLCFADRLSCKKCNLNPRSRAIVLKGIVSIRSPYFHLPETPVLIIYQGSWNTLSISMKRAFFRGLRRCMRGKRRL